MVHTAHQANDSTQEIDKRILQRSKGSIISVC